MSAWRCPFAWCDCMLGAPGSGRGCLQAVSLCLLAPEPALEEALCWGRGAAGSGQAHCRDGGNRHHIFAQCLTKRLGPWQWP